MEVLVRAKLLVRKAWKSPIQRSLLSRVSAYNVPTSITMWLPCIPVVSVKLWTKARVAVLDVGDGFYRHYGVLAWSQSSVTSTKVDRFLAVHVAINITKCLGFVKILVIEDRMHDTSTQLVAHGSSVLGTLLV